MEGIAVAEPASFKVCAYVDGCLGCEDKSTAARRRRMEIRRFKLVANASSGFIDVESSSSNKRLKLANGSGIAGHDIARDCPSAVKKSSSSSSSSSEELQETDGLSSGGEKALASLPSLYLLSADASLDDDDQCPPHGVVSVCGRRREMEDALAVMPSFIQCHHAHGVDASRVYHFFGVYDGHGGSQAAVYCKERLHQALAEEIVTKEPKTEVEWQIVMSNCFMRMDTEVAGLCSKKQGKSGQKIESQGGAPDTVGSTAVVAVVGSKQIIVGNCGDSRAVLSSGGKAIALSADHKPDRADEMVRIEAAGGRVIYWNGYRVLGVLAMSRAIGDRYLKPYVIAEPELTITERRDEDECLILASDGLWDVLSNEVVCEVARKCLGFGRTRNSEEMASCSAADPEIESPTATAAALLTKLALARGSTDNISVVVIDLKKNPLQISKAKL